MAPIAAAKMSELVTTPSVKGLRPSSDHTRVVPEEQAAEGRDQRDEAEPLAVRAAGERRQGRCARVDGC
jgi:hypothetical protein